MQTVLIKKTELPFSRWLGFLIEERRDGMKSISMLLLLLICMVTVPTVHAMQYVIIDLGTLGGNNCFPKAMNNKGQIIGSSKPAPGAPKNHSFLWEDGIDDLLEYSLFQSSLSFTELDISSLLTPTWPANE